MHAGAGIKVPKHRTHPLLMLFWARRFTEAEGMDWLQGRGWISDLCVTVWDVALMDVARVIAAAGRLGKLVSGNPERHVLEARWARMTNAQREWCPELARALGIPLGAG
jgi:hypothetical protein